MRQEHSATHPRKALVVTYCFAGLFILAAAFANKWFLEQVVSEDRYIESRAKVAAIVAFQVLLLLGALGLLWRRPALRLRL